MKGLQEKLGYTFQNPELLRQALTHSSYSHEHTLSYSNQRLEFLGDAVLGFLTARYLYEKFPQLSEGELTRRRALLVCEDSLSEAALGLGLGEYIRFSVTQSPEKNRKLPSILSDAFEAVLAAMLLDGGLDAVQTLLRTLLLRDTVTFPEVAKDPKTMLQEVVQREPGRQLSYRVVLESGPAHDREFSVEALLDGRVIGHGRGTSKKRAEQQAAENALANVRE